MPRHKRRDAEAAKRAADAACPEIITVVFFEDVDALMRTALPHCAALRLGEPPVPLRPCSSMDFLNEVCLLENGGLFKLRATCRRRPGRSRRSTTPPRAPAGAGGGARTPHQGPSSAPRTSAARGRRAAGAGHGLRFSTGVGRGRFASDTFSNTSAEFKRGRSTSGPLH